MLLAILNPMEQVRLFSEFFGAGGFERVIYASAAVNPHPQIVLEALANFQMPQGNPFQLTEQARAQIMGGNLARLHGIDVEQRKQALAADRFEVARGKDGLRAPWSSARASRAQASRNHG